MTNINKENFLMNKIEKTDNFLNLLKISTKIIFPCYNIFQNYIK